MIAYVFPGQGSQSKGMGQGLFPLYRDLCDRANRILNYSIEELCILDHEDKLNQTAYTQPALYIVNALTYINKLERGGRKPSFAAGHSLGEYNALLAAGAFDFEEGLRLVLKRSQLMSQASGGRMAAVIGIDEDKILQILRLHHLNSIDIANYNTLQQVIISGPTTDIIRAKTIFESQGLANYIPLSVNVAFHSRYMESAQVEFEKFLKGFVFSNINFPVISNVYAKPYQQNCINENLTKQMTHAVKWCESIQYLLSVGVSEITQIGPGKVLTGLVDTIRREPRNTFISLN